MENEENKKQNENQKNNEVKLPVKSRHGKSALLENAVKKVNKMIGKDK